MSNESPIVCRQESMETTMRWYARVRPGRFEDLAAQLNALIAAEGP
jgi:hypothetical protein